MNSIDAATIARRTLLCRRAFSPKRAPVMAHVTPSSWRTRPVAVGRQFARSGLAVVTVLLQNRLCHMHVRAVRPQVQRYCPEPQVLMRSGRSSVISRAAAARPRSPRAPCAETCPPAAPSPSQSGPPARTVAPGRAPAWPGCTTRRPHCARRSRPGTPAPARPGQPLPGLQQQRKCVSHASAFGQPSNRQGDVILGHWAHP